MEAERKARLRLVRILAGGERRLTRAARPGMVILQAAGGEAASAPAEAIAALARDGLAERAGDRLRLTAAGRAWLARESAAADPFLAQHRDVAAIRIAEADGAATVAVNLAESPLGQLARRRDRSGAPFLTAGEVAAGERFRSDYTRGRIMPRLGANWVASVATGRRGGAGGAVELTEAALAARQRVEQALDAVGPELSGVLVDVCCFLKGLETVEAERRWPARSAKLLLKAALGALARHYAPPPRTVRRALHWGTPDYRPTLDGKPRG